VTEWMGTIVMRPSRSRIPYYIKEGVSSIFRHSLMSFASVCIIFVFLIIMGAFILLALNINSLVGELESENIILAFVDENLSESEALALGRTILATPNVTETKFITREDAMQDFIGRHEDTDRYDDVDASWFRHRFAVHVDDVALIGETLFDLRDIYGIERVNANLTIARAMVAIRNAISAISIVIIVVLFAISLFIINNTIKLATYERREEIAIMKMVGATNGFIRWPFVFEGCILGMLGSMSSFILLWIFYRMLSDRAIEIESYLITLVPFSSVQMPLLLLFASIGFGVGIAGSTMALNRYLKI